MPVVLMKSQKGFTLIELLVSLALAAILVVSTGYAFRSQSSVYKTQEAIVTLQQGLRTAMLFIKRDLRLAGSDPSDSATIIGDHPDNHGKRAGILLAGKGGIIGTPVIKLAMNLSDPMGGVNFSPVIGDVYREIVQYDLNYSGDVLALRSNYQPVADWIIHLGFAYFDKAGNNLIVGDEDGVRPKRLNEIRRIQVTLTGQTPPKLGGIRKTLTSNVWCRNMVGR